jgi:hypothetical protein
MNLKKLSLYAVFAILFFLFGYYLFAGLTYSEGSRTGLLLKFSHKGYVFKTWEGQMNLGGISQQGGSIINNMWDFSVLEEEKETIDQLNKYEGKRIRLSYKEKYRHFPWQGETNYFVYKVEVIE